MIRAIGFGMMLLLAACAGQPVGGPASGPVQEPLPPGEVRWTVIMDTLTDLWYHGLAQTGFGASVDAPIYAPGYVERVQAAKRAVGVYPTVLDQRAEEFARLFAGDPRFETLQFLPLYFERGEDFFAAVRAWLRAGGDARRVGDPALAGAAALLSQQLPSAEERRVMQAWLDLLDQEQRSFHRAYRAGREAELSSRAVAVQREWDRVEPRIRSVLDYLMLNQGQIILSPALGPEGRTLDLGRRDNRVATLEPEASRPADAVWALLHELMYTFVADVIEDQVAPAQRRALEEQTLSRMAAVRAGALVLDQFAPDLAPEYHAAYLRWAGAAVPASTAERRAAFERSYPLPEGLPIALADGIANLQPAF